MVKPFAPAQLVQRFERIAKARKPFAVSSSYIGPDRRDLLKFSTDDEEVTLIEVPNTIGMKARGERIDFYELQKTVAGIMNEINDARLKQNAKRIAFLAGRVIEDISMNRFGGRVDLVLSWWGVLLQATGRAARLRRGGDCGTWWSTAA